MRRQIDCRICSLIMNGEGLDVGGQWVLAMPQVTLNEMTRQPLLGKW